MYGMPPCFFMCEEETGRMWYWRTINLNKAENEEQDFRVLLFFCSCDNIKTQIEQMFEERSGEWRNCIKLKYRKKLFMR